MGHLCMFNSMQRAVMTESTLRTCFFHDTGLDASLAVVFDMVPAQVHQTKVVLHNTIYSGNLVQLLEAFTTCQQASGNGRYMILAELARTVLGLQAVEQVLVLDDDNCILYPCLPTWYPRW